MILLFLAVCAIPLAVTSARLPLLRAHLAASRRRSSGELPGGMVAERLLRQYGLHDVGVACGGRPLSDRYDPGRRLLCLSPHVYFDSSVTSAAVAAHEVGHALQDRRAYLPLRLHRGLAPLSTLGNGSLFVALALAVIFRLPALAWISGAVFGCLLLPSLASLLVEVDAYRRARRILQESQVVTPPQQVVAAGFLRIALGTYLAVVVGLAVAAGCAFLLALRVAA